MTVSPLISRSTVFFTLSITRRLYSSLFSFHSRAASALAGEAGLGSHSSDWMDVRIAATS